MHKILFLSLVAALFLLAAAASVPQTANANPEVSPQQVVQQFYDEYRTMNSSLLADDAYKSSPYLSQEGVEYIEGVVAGFEGGGFDPFICAQDFPNTILAGEADMDGSTATVVADTDWGTQIKLTLELEGGEWKIARTDCLR